MTKFKGSLELNWINKDKSLLYEIDEKEGVGTKPGWVEKDDIRVAEPRILKLKEEYGDPNNENILIKGDNLLALKTLVEEFKNRNEEDKVKCIYIDPPFNTGSAFEYYDDNLEHSQWLTMMRDRLLLLKQLIREDGAIFIHIDDKELGYLILLGDEVFGRTNRFPIITIKRGSLTGPKVINPGVVNLTDYILIYSKDRSLWKPKRVYKQKSIDKRYGNYIQYRHFPPEQWKFITLRQAFSEYKKKPIKTLKNEMSDDEFEKELEQFVINNASSVTQKATLDDSKISAKAKKIKYNSINEKDKIFLLEREKYDNWYIINGKRILFYSDRLKQIDGELVPGELISNIWDDVLPNDLHNEGGVKFKKSKKPEKIISRVLELSSDPGDLILDSFLGSGTTAAVAHKMNRRWIGIEIGKHADILCAPRLKRVIEGKDASGITKSVDWKGGGGFRYYEVGESIIKDLDMNWSMTFEEMSRAVFMNFDYSIIGGDTHQLETEGDEFYLGKQKGGIAICLVTKGTKIIRRTELNKLVKDLSKKYPNQKVTIFTNMGVAVKPEELSDKLDVKKIPESILKKYRMV